MVTQAPEATTFFPPAALPPKTLISPHMEAVASMLGEAIGCAIVKHDISKKRDKVRHPDLDTMMASAVARLRSSARNKVARAA